MADLFHQLGVDWRLLVSQTVNFAIVLVVLTRFMYRPLLKMMSERRVRIKKGLEGAEEADRRLRAIEAERKVMLLEADEKAAEMIKGAEKDASVRVDEMIIAAEGRAADIMKEGERITEQRRDEEFTKFRERAGMLVREAIARAVSENPHAVDEKLVGQAVAVLKEKKTI